MGLSLERGLPPDPAHTQAYGFPQRRDREWFYLLLGGKALYRCDDVVEVEAIWGFFQELSREDVKIERMREPDRLLNRFKFWLPPEGDQ